MKEFNHFHKAHWNIVLKLRNKTIRSLKMIGAKKAITKNVMALKFSKDAVN